MACPNCGDRNGYMGINFVSCPSKSCVSFDPNAKIIIDGYETFVMTVSKKELKFPWEHDKYMGCVRHRLPFVSRVGFYPVIFGTQHIEIPCSEHSFCREYFENKGYAFLHERLTGLAIFKIGVLVPSVEWVKLDVEKYLTIAFPEYVQKICRGAT